MWRFARKSLLEVVVLRPALVYGPDDETTMPRLADYLREPTAVWVGPHNPTVDPIYVSDVLMAPWQPCIRRPLSVKHTTFRRHAAFGYASFGRFVCRELSIQPPKWTVPAVLVDWAAIASETVARLLGRHRPPALTRAGVSIFGIDRHHNPSKAKRDLGWQAKVNLQDGIRLAVATLNAEQPIERVDQRRYAKASLQPV